MDESVAQDVVKHRSEGDTSLPDVIATSKSTVLAVNGQQSDSQISSSSPRGLRTGDDISQDQTDGTQSTGNSGSFSNQGDETTDNAVQDLGNGSDSDTARARSATIERQSDERGHNRTNSLKKPAAFKAVSVTKNFLAKAALGGGSGSKQGEKGGIGSVTGANSTNQTAPRPRLVAKSGSGLRESIPKSINGGKGGERGAGSEASQVWNKNRPAQPATSKQITDEELKQQYGIHLATRLQTDEGKEAKWADIDDDDDDWAPDTLEWIDGTKVTLPHSDEPPAEVAAAPPPSKIAAAHPAKSTPSVVQPPIKTPTTVKTLTPSTNKSSGLVLKAANEKPTLVAKPPGPPTPAKSPWAQLPPVDKVPPVTINPQVTNPPAPRIFPKDPHGFDSMQPPAKEIAADDFNRSWRDNHQNSTRELFNSQSGRYEPVSDTKRVSTRSDQNFRQPSVLQRPSPVDQKGLAEPSAAFQTHRSSATNEIQWGRRRASSNLSGSSGQLARRMSIGKNQDGGVNFQEQMLRRRDSQVIGESATSPAPNLSKSEPKETLADAVRAQLPHERKGQGATEAASADDTKVSGQGQPHDPVALQKEIMRAAREQARERRKAEEERLEMEKQERIRLKLEALGGPPTPIKKDHSPEVSLVEQSKSHTKATDKVVPPRPPIPETNGDVRQYGMMKVHHPESVRPHGKVPTGSSEAHSTSNRPNTVAHPSPAVKILKDQESDTPVVNGHLKDESIEPGRDAGGAMNSRSQTESRPNLTWKTLPSSQDNYVGWSTASMTSHSSTGGNLWGPPSSDKALGNGTFDSGFSRLAAPTAHQPHQLSPSPGPIGPPSPSPRLQSAELSPSVAPRQVQGIQDSRYDQTGLHSHDTDRTLGGQATPSGPLSSQPASLHPHSQNRPLVHMSTNSQQPGVKRSTAAAAWADLPARLQREEEAAAREYYRKQAVEKEEEELTGIRKEVARPVYHESWKAGPGSKRVETVLNHNSAAQLPSVPAQLVPHSQGLAGPRESRFFPIHHESQAQGHPQIQATDTTGERRSSSPPPPETMDHPACDGNRVQPLVSLPVPKPVVKLPPSLSQPQSLPENPPASKASPERVVATTATLGWQEKIYGLFSNRKPSPPKSYAHVATTSSASLAAANSAGLKYSNQATVSLPKSTPTRTRFSIFVIDDSSDVTSKTGEEVLLGEPELGSLPQVTLPKSVPAKLYHPAVIPRSKFRPQKSIQAVSVEPLKHEPEGTSQGILIRIRFPSQKEKSVLKPRAAGVTNRQRGPSSTWKDRRKGPKSRDVSGHNPYNKNADSPSARPPLPSGQWSKTASPASAR